MNMGDDNILRFHRPAPGLYRPVSSRRFKRNIMALMCDTVPARPVPLKSRSNDN
ncbi:hypothetical protein [uncultured Sphingobium sp.]|jgi:hypothetical protein|uniref:hypothetical protein n=2 Tax=Sphingomonadaceae TaxID=41297 RepID=UPI00259BBBB4|nr:hypothetical protein [uncultured Sphingobium sp.]